MQSDEPGTECIEHLHGDPDSGSAYGRGSGNADEHECELDGASVSDGASVGDYGDVQRNDDHDRQQSECYGHGNVQQQFGECDVEPGSAGIGVVAGVQSDQPGTECIEHLYGDPDPGGAYRRGSGGADEYECDADGSHIGNGGRGGYNRWTLNGKSWPATDQLLTTEVGKRYRLIMTNKSGDNHPIHLHRHTFEVTKVGDKATAGVMKDTINMTRFSSVEIDFVADDPGPSLLHCHHQDHQDEGFMGLVTYL